MQKNNKKRGLFSLLLPFLIYYAVAYVVQFIAVVVWMQPKIPELMKMDPEMLTAAYIMQNYMPYLIEQSYKYLSIITMAVAAGVIPFLILLFRQDIAYEKMLGMPVIEKKPLRKYGVIIGIAIPLAIAATNIITLANIPAYSESYQETSKLLYEASFWSAAAWIWFDCSDSRRIDVPRRYL